MALVGHCLSLGNLTLFFIFFLKIVPDFKHHKNKFAQPYLPYLNSQQLRLESSICNPRNFQVHWQDICITSRFKLKRTYIFKLGTTDMIEQSKIHPLNLSKGVKTFLPRIIKKGNKAVNFYFVVESFFIKFYWKQIKGYSWLRGGNL